MADNIIEIKCPKCGKPQLAIYPSSAYAIEQKDNIRTCIDCVRKEKEKAEIEKKANEEQYITFDLPRRDGELLQKIITKALDTDSGSDLTISNQMSFLLGKIAKALNKNE